MRSIPAKHQGKKPGPLRVPSNFQEDYYIQKRPPQNTTFQSLFEVAANKMGIGREFRAVKVCHEARKIVSRLLPEYSSDISVVSFKNGALALSVANPALRQRIHTRRHLLMEQINSMLAEDLVQKVTIRV